MVVGTTTIDVVLTGTDRLPAAGADEFTADSIALLEDPVQLTLGGNGANTAAVYARLGGAVALVSAVGGDELGGLAIGRLAEAGVDLTALRRDGSEATACTVVATDRARRRLALHHAGASSSLSRADVPDELLGRASVVLLTSYHLLPALRGETAAALLRHAHACGALTALDLGPCVEPFADLHEVAPVLRETDLVLANEHEVGISTAGAGCAALLAAGAGAVVEKRGAHGSCFSDAGGDIVVLASEVAATSTVGAGDAFDAGYLFAVGRGDPPERALAFANVTAALTLARGMPRAPAAAEVDAALG